MFMKFVIFTRMHLSNLVVQDIPLVLENIMDILEAQEGQEVQVVHLVHEFQAEPWCLVQEPEDSQGCRGREKDNRDRRWKPVAC